MIVNLVYIAFNDLKKYFSLKKYDVILLNIEINYNILKKKNYTIKYIYINLLGVDLI